MDEQAWRNKSVEILTDIKEWRRVHPKATYVEIEDEVHKRMMELEAQILQDAAQASRAASGEKRQGSKLRCVPPVPCLCKHEGNTNGPYKEMEGSM